MRQKGTYGYLDKNKFYEWRKAALFLAVPVLIFLGAWALNRTRMSVMTVVAIVGCLPGCNQVVRAILSSRYHSISRELYEATEQARGERFALYENVFTTYEQNFYVDCLVISGRNVAGYSSDARLDAAKAMTHIRTLLKNNAYKQNVKIFTDREAFLRRVRELSENPEEEVPFREDDRYPGMGRDEIIRCLLTAISL